MICPVFRDRRRLYERINARVDRMLEKGLLEEAQKLYSFCKSAPKPPTAAQSIGYKELFPYFEGHIALEEAVENIKRESRRYAKRQLTWFAREPEIRYLYMDGLCGTDAALEECMKILESCEFYTELSLREGGGSH